MSMEDPNTLYPNHEKLSFRSYQHIHVDESTDSKGVFPILGYNSDVGYIQFPADEETWFHYPISGDDVERFEIGDLNNTGLVFDGAFWGDRPSRADRFYVKNDDYHFESVNGDYKTEEKDWVKNGVWLCAWLSGTCVDDNPPQWVDRWYDPSRTTAAAALLATTNNNAVYDVPSRIRVSAGLYCKYSRIGDVKIEEINANINETRGAKLVIDDWTEVLRDGPYISEGITVDNFRNPDMGDTSVYVDEACSFNGNGQYVFRKYDKDEVLTDFSNFSISTWLKVGDTKNHLIGPFLGCGCKDGWELGVHNKPFLNLSVYAETGSETGRVYVKNAKDELISHKEFGTSGQGVKIFSAISDIDGYIWILCEMRNRSDETKYDLVLLKCDTALVIMDRLTLVDGGLIATRDAVVWDCVTEYGKCIVQFIRDTSTIYKLVDKIQMKDITTSQPLNPKVETVSSGNQKFALKITVNGKSGYYDVNTSKGFVWSGGHGPDEDDGEFYTLDNSKKRIPDEDVGRVIAVACDWDNTYWALLRPDDTCGFPVDKSAVVSYKYDEVSGKYIRDRVIVISRVSDLSRLRMNIFMKNGVFLTAFLILDKNSNVCYLVDRDSGHEIKEFRLGEYGITLSFDDRVTNYDWQRTCCTKDKLYFRVHVCNPQDATKREVRTYAYDIGDKLLDGKYHHISVIKDGSKVHIVFDCKMVSSTSVENVINDWNIWYVDNNGLYIGASRLPSVTKYNLPDIYSDVVVDDIRLFDGALSVDDVRYIFFAKYHLCGFYWYYNAYNRYMLEEIEHFNRFKMPGSKSAHFEIHIKGFNGTDGASVDDSVKQEIEASINGAIKMLTPSYTDIFRIVWDK